MIASLTACANSKTLAPVESLTPQGNYTPSLGSSSPAATDVQPLPVQSSQQKEAPVENQSLNAPAYTAKTYTVKKGDTLYSIAFLAGMDYEELAAINHISAPYTLSIGQVLQLQNNASASSAPSNNTEAASFKTIFWSPNKQEQPSVSSSASTEKSKPAFQWRPQKQVAETLPNHATWQWPVQGKVISGFSTASGGNRGLDISGRFGEPIKAAAAGQVVYSGNGIRGYGNIIIIKNTRHFLSAYAFNANNLVHDGQWVKQGQTIATMGKNLAGQTMLHFEIRFYGKAVDPMRYLK